jgi:hypothetical protein
MMKCPFCQFDNEDGALFCEQCKSDLGPPAQPVIVAGEAPSAETISGERPLETVPLAAEPASEAGVLASIVEAVPVAEVAPPEMSATLSTPYAEPAPPYEEPPQPHAEAVQPYTEPAPAQATPADPAPAESHSHAAAEELPAPVTEPASALRAASIPGISEREAEGKPKPGIAPKLVVLRGQRVNIEYPLYEGENYIGRADEKAVDVDLEDQEPQDRVWSSRQHALILVENGSMTIEDLNSLNGTYVNRTRVHPGQKRPLQPNDVIQIGTVQMKVKV